MNNEREAFLRALQENPEDRDLREVYADWLEEQGFDDEARAQRAEVYLRGYAARITAKETYGKYYKDDEREWEPHELVSPISYEKLLKGANKYLDQYKGEGEEWIPATLYLSFDIPDFVYEQREQFWEAIEAVTGRKVHDKTDFIFRCSC